MVGYQLRNASKNSAEILVNYVANTRSIVCMNKSMELMSLAFSCPLASISNATQNVSALQGHPQATVYVITVRRCYLRI
jgi:quinolinate synthase